METVAIVTGGANGIGRGVVERFVSDGYFVAFVDNDDASGKALEATLNQKEKCCKFFHVDVRDHHQVEDVLKQIDRLGKISVLVNNAGYSKDDFIEDIEVEDWDGVLNAHLRASFLFIKGVTPTMKKHRYGRIVNISSISANGHAERVSYCAAKAGMHGLIKSVAVELGEYGITANVVAPGLTVTNMTKISAARRNRTLDEHVQKLIEQIAVKRSGTPEDIAHAVSFFADKNSGFVTGQVLFVSGNPD